MIMQEIPEDTILDAVVHERLITDLPHVCEVAAVPPMYVHQSMHNFCKQAEIDWVANYNIHKKDGCAGLCMSGSNSESRCMAIAGALLRNFIDARVITLNQLIESAGRGDTPDPSVMVVPNLFVVTHGKGLTSWQIQTVYDVLLGRMANHKPTVVYVESLPKVGEAYGKLVYEHLVSHFLIAE